MGPVPRGRRGPSSRPANGERKKPSPSPTRCAGTELTKPAASPPPPPRTPGWMEPPLPAPAGDGSWLILDRFVHYSRRHRGVVEGDATTSSPAEDCAGRHVRVSLRIADPPAVSRLYLHWTDRPQIALPFTEPAAIAAHRNSILFRMTVPFDDFRWWHDTPSFPTEHFVYSCCSSSSPPSLTALPPCFHGGGKDRVLDKAVRQHRSQRQRIMFDEDMGILCHGDNGEFTVAHLACRRKKLELCLVHHPPSASGAAMEWSVKELKTPPDMKIDLKSWRNDVVIPIGKSLCWVDYYQGLLLVDVLAVGAQSKPNPEHLHGIRLPAQALKPCRLYDDVGEPDPFRHVCVTDNGIIKLVCVFANHPPSDDDFKIITWTLVDINKGSWIKVVDTIMVADKFFGLYDAAQSCLPRVNPTFPVMSLVDPDVICFLLKKERSNLTWMVEVNMRSKVLQSSTLYINKEEEGHPSEKDKEEGHPSEKDSIRSFFGHYFIPTKFSSYLSKDAITSRKLSEGMQKAKEERAMQKAKEERAMQKGKVKEEPKE
nr:unnamed protein product [Digitaria exilis]CAB3502768.1 unnamed protein product [Digitaria exilis]